MATLGELKSRIADEFNRTDITSQIEDHILLAIKHYERQRWWFNETRAGSALVASQANYALTSLSISDLMMIDTVEVTVSSHTYRLREISWEEYRDTWGDTGSSTGAPTDYTVYSDQIWVGPIPTSAYSVDVSYVKTLAVMDDDSDTNEWTTTGEDLIANRAMKTIAARVLHLGQEALVYQALETEALTALQTQNVQRLTTGQMRYHE
jgi:hypothetical protein